MVTNAVSYLSNLNNLTQSTQASSKLVLEDFDKCGIRNNDTFNLCSKDNPTSIYCNKSLPLGGGVTSDWSAECLWDCTWKLNPYRGQSITFRITPNDQNIDNAEIYSSVSKIPEDLRCLSDCTEKDFPAEFWNYTAGGYQTLDCSNFIITSYNYTNNNFTQYRLYFESCYIRFRGYQLPFVSKTYFDMAVEFCILARVNPDLYNNANCDTLGVNLRIFNSLLPAPFLSNSTTISKVEGPSSDTVTAFQNPILTAQDALKNRYPWQCSLRTAGYNGIHRCGVTLLSGPPKPTIFVSAAHCNYVCKNKEGGVVETCCCRNITTPASCGDSDFCGQIPELQLAEPGDLQIACNITNLETHPKGVSPLNTILLDVLKIVNHEKYNQSIGPVGGHDISVYIVNDTQLKLDPDFIWPACLPQQKEDLYFAGKRGILSGWIAPLPTYFYTNPYYTLRDYVTTNLRQREALYEQVKCTDPDWMKSNTPYPAGTVCYTDAAFASSVQFGVSGSGIVRPFSYQNDTITRYSWAGPLSLSKGSDSPVLIPVPDSRYRPILNSGSPGVFTDARCYMDWIASQYNMTMPEGYRAPDSCSQSTGDTSSFNNAKCLSRGIHYTGLNDTLPCNFTKKHPKCKLYAFDTNIQPEVNSNFFYCYNTKGKKSVCANNCPGVDPNAIVVGGVALAFATGAVAVGAAPNLLFPVLGAGSLLAAAGLGGVNMNMRRTPTACPPRQCRARLAQQCCRLIPINGQQLCPNFC